MPKEGGSRRPGRRRPGGGSRRAAGGRHSQRDRAERPDRGRGPSGNGSSAAPTWTSLQELWNAPDEPTDEASPEERADRGREALAEAVAPPADLWAPSGAQGPIDPWAPLSIPEEDVWPAPRDTRVRKWRGVPRADKIWRPRRIPPPSGTPGPRRRSGAAATAVGERVGAGEAGERAPTDGRGRPSGERADLSKLARGGALNFAGAVASGVFGFALVIVVTRGLPSSKAGVFFEAIALFSIVANVSELGADDGMIRMIARYRALDRIRDLRGMLLIGLAPVLMFGSLLGALIFVFAPQLSHIFIHGHRLQADALVPYIRLLAPFVPLAAVLQTLFSASRGFGTMVPSVILDNFGRSGSRPVLALIVILAGLGSTALAFSWAVPTLVALLVMWFWVRRLLHRTERRARRAQHEGLASIAPAAPRAMVAGEFWRFAAPRAVAALFGITVYWLDTLLLGAIRTTKDAAVYTAASRYLFVGFFALGAIQLVIGPMISALLTEGNHDRAKNLYQTATQWLVAASWPIYITLCVFAPLLLRIFKAEYVSGQDAMFTLSIAMLVSIASGPVMVVLLMSGKSMWTLANSMVSLALNIALNLLLIPKHGMEGAAIAWLVSIVFSNLAGIFEVRYLLKLTPFGRTFPIVALASGLCYGAIGVAVRLVFGMSAVSFIAFGLVATALYTAILWRFRGPLHFDMLLEGIRLRRERGAARAARPA